MWYERSCAIALLFVFVVHILGRRISERQWIVDEVVFHGTETSL